MISGVPRMLRSKIHNAWDGRSGDTRRFANKRPWQKEIKKVLSNGFKMEVEAMISKDLSYLTEQYVPMKLKDKKQWLD